MPIETQNAVNWAIGQTVVYENFGFEVTVSKDTPIELVEKVREYFNTNNIGYSTFSYADLEPYL